jgi:hypothetical protein
MEVAIQIGFERAVKMRFGQILQVTGLLLERGVVYKNVEAAEFPRGAAYGFPAEFRIGNITCDHNTVPAFVLDGCCGFVCVGVLAPSRANSTATARPTPSRRKPPPAISATFPRSFLGTL